MIVAAHVVAALREILVLRVVALLQKAEVSRAVDLKAVPRVAQRRLGHSLTVLHWAPSLLVVPAQWVLKALAKTRPDLNMRVLSQPVRCLCPETLKSGRPSQADSRVTPCSAARRGRPPRSSP